MNFVITTQAHPNGDIVQTQKLQSDLSGICEQVLHDVIHTKEEQVKAALKQLGWTSPEDKESIRQETLREVQKMMNDTLWMHWGERLKEMISIDHPSN